MIENSHSDQIPQPPTGSNDTYSNIEISKSTGTAIGPGATANVTTQGVDGKVLERVFMQVYEAIDRLDDSEYDKSRLKYLTADLREELAKPEPDRRFIARCWEKLKDLREMSSILLPVIQQFLQHRQNG